MSDFNFAASEWVPFKDKTVIEKVRNIRRADIERHSNPDFKIKVYPDADVEFVWVTDLFTRIFNASINNERLVLILPNPCPSYRHVARLINANKIDCKNIFAFAMDEYADENGNVAPADWRFSFTHSMFYYFYDLIDPALRPQKNQFVGFTNNNIADYGKMIEDCGGADVCYSGPGWTGHLAFIEPDAPEFAGSLEEWREMGSRIVTLSPFTLAQNSLHGLFGKSGDLAAVPPKAATIGPKEVISAKHRVDTHSISVHGTTTSWQRLMTRLVLHGPVTPLVPESILQTLKTDVLLSETAAMDIEEDWNKGY